MRPIETVFHEEIKPGDKIMYLYMQHGNMHFGFGRVIKRYKHPAKYMDQGWEWKLKVLKTTDVDWDGKWQKVKKIVYLTNPTAFMLGKVLEEPL